MGWLKKIFPSSTKEFVWAVIGGLLIYWIPQWLASESEDWKLTEKQFYRWRVNFDQQLEFDHKQFIEDEVKGGYFLSGDIRRHEVNFYQNKRMQLDKTIDSFLIAYTLAGGDTLNLKYKRKLGINVFGIISKHEDVAFHDSLRSLYLDTL